MSLLPREALILCWFAVLPARSAEIPSVQVSSPTRCGIDVLESRAFDILQGKQVGLITNQTGRDARGRSAADVLFEAPGVKLMALFSPEHGIRGNQEHGLSVGDSIDAKTHLPVYSLYGGVQKPTPEMLNAIDVLVFDIQDVGVRFYTYLTTMGLAMEAAAKRKIAFVVLDRPNPLGGEIVEGQVLSRFIRHFTAYFNVPARHGFTAGELAQWYNATEHLGLKLTVVPMTGWTRDRLWVETGLPFVPPSPNIRSPTAALLYAGVGMFETTNVSVGRGTEDPFERIGAPWMNGAELAHQLEALNLPGLKFYQTLFVPSQDLYQGRLCSGIRIVVTDAHQARPVDLFVQVSMILRRMAPKDFELRWEDVARVTGSRDFERFYKAGKSADDILKIFHNSAEGFKKDRQPYLLYSSL